MKITFTYDTSWITTPLKKFYAGFNKFGAWCYQNIGYHIFMIFLSGTAISLNVYGMWLDPRREVSTTYAVFVYIALPVLSLSLIVNIFLVYIYFTNRERFTELTKED